MQSTSFCVIELGKLGLTDINIAPPPRAGPWGYDLAISININS